MRFTAVLGAVSLSALSSHAFAQSPSPSDFVMKASIGNAFEIEEASLALKQSSSQPVKEFAHMMTTDHTKAEKKLEAAASSANATAAPKLDDAHQAKVEALRGKTGTAFDTGYVSDQVHAHQETADLLASYAKDGDNPTLKAWAAETLPTVNEHLAHAKTLAGR